MRNKVLFIMHMPPPVHGAAMVGKYIHDSKIVNETFECRYENMMLASSLEDIGRGGVKKVFNLFAQLRRFNQAIKEFKPDLVYVTPNAAGGAFYKDFIVVQFLKHSLKKHIGRSGTPLLLHFHNKGVRSRQNKFLDNFLYKRFFKNVKVILLAESLYSDVQKYVDRENVSICPNGIPRSLDFEPTAARDNAVPKILFLSNLIISKGILVLLDALRILNKKGIPFECTFVGRETEEMNAEKFNAQVAARDLCDKVVYAGCKYGNDKRAYFENADIFAFPTFYFNEAFPLVNIEAMEYKLPVVSTNEGGILGMITDSENGFISEKQNPESLATALQKLLENKSLRIKMGENGYKKFISDFTLNSFESNFTECLRKAMFCGE